MTKVLGVLLLAVLAVGVLGVAQTAVTPRAAEGVLLFDNETGAEVTRIGILFDGPITLCKNDIVAFGGEAVTRLDVGLRTAWIDVVVVPGGTLQITLAGNTQVSSAYWVSSVQEKTKVVCRWLIEAMWNTGDLDLIAEFMAPASVFHGDSFVGELPGVGGYTAFATMSHTALPDIHFTIEDLIAEDDMVAMRLSYTGTNTGPFLTIPATGASIVARAMVAYRFSDGKIQEGWINVDGLNVLTQMGLIPPMGPPNYTWGTLSTVTGDPGTPEENKINASREPSKIWNEADFAAIDEIISEDYVGHYDMSTVNSCEAYKQYLSGLFTAFPDVHITVEKVFAEGDLVAFVATAAGTHLGPFGPAPATGNSMKVQALVIRRMADGKIVELWQLNDMLGLLMQIGLVPPLQ
ncbi:ester cyclase [Candidatus Bipolaricaulota bacterium]|nr:ester cyclase [Candidatus Bipolaricaulota bacterium]